MKTAHIAYRLMIEGYSIGELMEEIKSFDEPGFGHNGPRWDLLQVERQKRIEGLRADLRALGGY